jgi:hypothetical protein
MRRLPSRGERPHVHVEVIGVDCRLQVARELADRQTARIRLSSIPVFFVNHPTARASVPARDVLVLDAVDDRLPPPAPRRRSGRQQQCWQARGRGRQAMTGRLHGTIGRSGQTCQAHRLLNQRDTP